ncbi:MAG: uroporphyrinogen decarboxylase family protein [Halodesulfurarchaeum sp.]
MVSLDTWVEGEGIDFVSSEAEAKYREKAERLRAAVVGETPDRVPVRIRSGYLAGHLADVTFEEMMYDPEKAANAYRHFLDEFDPDNNHVTVEPPGKPVDILEYQLYNWPGSGVDENSGFQALDDEYMKPEDYDELIDNPEAWFLRHYMPRVFGKLEGLEKLPNFSLSQELPMSKPLLLPFGDPAVQDALEALMEAGDEMVKWQQSVGSVASEAEAKGYPSFSGGYSKAPFDTVGDMLRGTRNAMIDIRKRPEKIKAASRAVMPMMKRMGTSGPKATGSPFVLFVLHKGADEFMSQDDFEEFYWPTLKETMEAVIDEGFVPLMFAEGSYDNRLDFLADNHPDGHTVWIFDRTDVRDAKEIIGDQVTVAGGVSTSLLKTGDPEKIRDHCERLIEEAGPDRFILSTSARIYRAPRENLQAMIESVKG